MENIKVPKMTREECEWNCDDWTKAAAKTLGIPDWDSSSISELEEKIAIKSSDVAKKLDDFKKAYKDWYEEGEVIDNKIKIVSQERIENTINQKDDARKALKESIESFQKKESLIHLKKSQRLFV